jgi:nucleotide-binding universal stress UspA family protein
LLVMGRAGASTLTGSTGLGKHLEWVIRCMNRPVLVATDTCTEPSQVLFAFDGSAVALRGIDMLIASALLKGLPIHLVMSGAVHAQRQRQLEGAVQTLKNAGIEATSALLSGTPANTLLILEFNLTSLY